MINMPFTAAASYARTNADELAIALLHPYIEKAVTDFYGYNRRYEIGESELEITERKGNVFSVKVIIGTFTGAHNDYFTEILTFEITPVSVSLKEYIHCEFIT